MKPVLLGVSILTTLALLAPVAEAANPPRPSFREGKADFHDKELSLTYAFGPGSVDFALFEQFSLGVAVDRVVNANDWYYRATYRVVEDRDMGLAIAFNGGATQTRERLAGDQIAPPVWGYTAGLLATFATDSGLIFRAGVQMYDTDFKAEGGQQVLLTPEIAYRFSLLEITLQPSFPLDFSNFQWVGIRLRI